MELTIILVTVILLVMFTPTLLALKYRRTSRTMIFIINLFTVVLFAFLWVFPPAAMICGVVWFTCLFWSLRSTPQPMDT